MGNCIRCGRKKRGENGEVGEAGVKGRKGLKRKKDKKSKTKSAKDDKKGSEIKTDERNGRAEEHPLRGHEAELERDTYFGDGTIYASELGPQERKVLRLVLPFIPKKQWGKLREVCKTWCAVVDGEWARMHTLHLTELVPPGSDYPGADFEKGRLVADHVSSKCQLSRAILCVPAHDGVGAVDLTDEEFWRRLVPRTNDLTTLRLRSVYLPKYFFTNFLPRCKNLEILEVSEAPGGIAGRDEEWTEADRERLRSTISGLTKLRNVRLDLKSHRLESDSGKHLNSLPLSRDVKMLDTAPISNNYAAVPSANSHYSPQDGEAILTNSAGPHLKTFTNDNVSLTPRVLKTLGSCTNLTSLSFYLNVDLLSPFEHERAIRNTFSSFEHLRDLRINIVSNERNTYETLQTLALILNTVAEHSHKLNTLKLIRLPDPMGIDKPLATDISTAFVKLNDETQLINLHVCVLAPQELFHVWSLPWSALTHLRTLTLTDCNLYPQRPRCIDLEALVNLNTFALCSDSLDDDMVMRVFAQPHAALSDLTLEPGPKGIGKGGLCTIAVACQNLRRLTISYSRTRDQNKNSVDAHGWTAFFRAVPNTLKAITLIDLERRYLNEEISPVARQCPQIEVRPIYDKASFDTYADFRPVTNGGHYND